MTCDPPRDAFERRLLQALARGQAIADVVGDPFGTAEEYAAMDRGEAPTDQLSFDDLPPTEEEWLEQLTLDALVTIRAMKLERRFGYLAVSPRSKRARKRSRTCARTTRRRSRE